MGSGDRVNKQNKYKPQRALIPALSSDRSLTQSRSLTVHPLTTSWWSWTLQDPVPYKCLDYRNDPLKECFTVKWDIILSGFSQADSKLYTSFGIKVFCVHVQYASTKSALCYKQTRTHTKRKDEKEEKTPTSPRWSQSMEPSSYQLTPVACSQRSGEEEKEREEKRRGETGHWFRVRRLGWGLIGTSLSITPLTLLSPSLYFNLSIIPLICVAFLPSAFAKGQITWKGRQHLNRTQTMSSMRRSVCVCERERDSQSVYVFQIKILQ